MLQRTLAAEITQGKVPKSWNKYAVPDSVTLSVWMSDFGMCDNTRVDEKRNARVRACLFEYRKVGGSV